MEIEPPYDPAIPLLGIYLKETKTVIWKDTCTQVFMWTLFTTAKTWNNLSGLPLMNEYRRCGTYIQWNGTVHVCMLSCVWLFETPWTIARQAPLSMGFSRQEYWSGLPCPPPGDLPDPGIEPMSVASPALAGGFFTTAPPGKSKWSSTQSQKWMTFFPLQQHG